MFRREQELLGIPVAHHERLCTTTLAEIQALGVTLKPDGLWRKPMDCWIDLIEEKWGDGNGTRRALEISALGQPNCPVCKDSNKTVELQRFRANGVWVCVNYHMFRDAN